MSVLIDLYQSEFMLKHPKSSKDSEKTIIVGFRPIQTCFSKYSEGHSKGFRHEIFIREGHLALLFLSLITTSARKDIYQLKYLLGNDIYHLQLLLVNDMYHLQYLLVTDMYHLQYLIVNDMYHLQYLIVNDMYHLQYLLVNDMYHLQYLIVNDMYHLQYLLVNGM